jgi:predicted RNA-binding Zn-ribbon protein involved in translation (DUF1610 family)
MAGEDIVAALQDEIDSTQSQLEQTRGELAEFQCPTCGAKLVSSVIIPTDDGKDDYRVEDFECGFERTEWHMSRPCPYSDKFPNPEDYDLSTSEETHGSFICWARGKTYMASLVKVWPGRGATPEDAEAETRRRLPRRRELPRRR